MGALATRWFAAVSVLVLGLCGPAAAQDPATGGEAEEADSGRAVLGRAVERRGGRGALEALRDYEAVLVGRARTGGGAMAEVEVRRQVRFGEPPCLRAEQVIRSDETEFREVVLLRGDRGWRRTSFGGGPYTREQVAREWARFRRSDLGILRAWLDPAIPIERLARGKLGAIETEVIRVRRPGDEPCTVDLDPATGHVLRIRWDERTRDGAPPHAVEVRFSDFRPLGGVAGVPRKAEVVLGGEVVQTRVTKEWRVNVGLKAETFEWER